MHTGTYLGTIGFAYLCFVMFLLFFFALVVFQGAVTEELGLRECGWHGCKLPAVRAQWLAPVAALAFAQLAASTGTRAC